VSNAEYLNRTGDSSIKVRRGTQLLSGFWLEAATPPNASSIYGRRHALVSCPLTLALKDVPYADSCVKGMYIFFEQTC